MLFDATTNTEETVQIKRRRIDRSIGYLVLGVAVLSFFLMTVLGMRWVQGISDQTASLRTVASEPRSAEIGDSPVAEPLPPE